MSQTLPTMTFRAASSITANSGSVIGVTLYVLPNESRLSCGAKLKYSQMEFYHTARRTFAGLFEEGRRQLQALLGCAPQVIARVRPRQERRGALAITCLTPGL